MVKSQSRRLDLVFQALSDSTRRAILRDIAKKEKTVSQIAKPYRMSLAAVSKHLKVLENAKLVDRRKEGSFQIVKLNAEALMDANQWIAHYEQFWNEKLEALKKYLEQEDE